MFLGSGQGGSVAAVAFRRATPYVIAGKLRVQSIAWLAPPSSVLPVGMQYRPSEGSGRATFGHLAGALRVLYANVLTFSHVSCPFVFPD